jgi:hypothetical protein
MSPSIAILIGAVAVVASLVGTLEWYSRSNVATVGFWFDPAMTFEVHDPRRFSPPLTPEEQERIKAVARAEVGRAFADFRVRVTDSRYGFYRVAVSQLIRPRGMARYTGAAGESYAFGPLGGYGTVSFYLLAAQAMSHAPPGASRADIVDAMGRGIGRAAVHELAHQLLPHTPIHASDDPATYEYWSSNRAAQYYGDIRWSVARPKLQERFARR